MRVLLVSTYELGHQPVHVASPAAALRAAGHEVRALDLSVQDWDAELASWADKVAFSVPMHTAMRLAVPLAGALKAQDPELPVCLYGLYAAMGRNAAAAAVCDRVIVGEYEPALISWAAGDGADGTSVHLGRSGFRPPARDLLPPLERYARLLVDGESRLAAAVEASHGCSHRCRHCPLPVVYDGRLRIVSEEVVLADVAQLVTMGARHITFSDPDFLNGPKHALRVVEAVHSSFPGLTFDLTTKVEHILEHPGIWATMAGAGCLFVVSAFESTDGACLAILDKGHTRADEAAAVAALRRHGIELRPSWLPFTPWAKPAHLADMLDFVAENDLVDNVDPVQYTIRLLLPEGSLLLEAPEVVERLAGYDAERLTWLWTAAEPAMDELAAELARLVEEEVSSGSDPGGVYDTVRARLFARFGSALSPGSSGRVARGPAGPRPRLSEPWFCCSEPTTLQRQAVGAAGADL